MSDPPPATPSPMQIRADAMRLRALGFDPETLGPPDPNFVVVIDAIADPATSPVPVSGTITPGGFVDVGIVQDDGMGTGVVDLAMALIDVKRGIEALHGIWGYEFSLPPGTGYQCAAHPSGKPENAVFGNTFSVSTPV